MAMIELDKYITVYTEIPITPELEKLIHPHEKVLLCMKTGRDGVVFTDKRMLYADKQGLMVKKTEYLAIPYKNILYYTIETAGLDLESEIRLTIVGNLNLEFKFMKNPQTAELLFKVYQIIAEYAA